MRTDWGYVALCLLAPLVWGVVSARVFDYVQARRVKPADAPNVSEAPADDGQEMYHI